MGRSGHKVNPERLPGAMHTIDDARKNAWANGALICSLPPAMQCISLLLFMPESSGLPGSTRPRKRVSAVEQTRHGWMQQPMNADRARDKAAPFQTSCAQS